MAPDRPIERPLGTMIAYGFPKGDVGIDLAIAERLGARLLEILPDWANEPDPAPLKRRVARHGMAVHSVHACWGGQSIRAPRVDLASTDETTHRASLDDLRRCLDWIAEVGGTYLVVHPGGLSAPEDAPARRDALAAGLLALADHAGEGGPVICVENMPPGVHPGTRMDDLAPLISELDHPALALALDTGHAHIASTPEIETLAAGRHLRTTHVHDNDGRHDSHHPPGSGSVDWDRWLAALDAVGYEGPIMLECIRHLRRYPESLDEPLFDRLARLTTNRGPSTR